MGISSGMRHLQICERTSVIKNKKHLSSFFFPKAQTPPRMRQGDARTPNQNTGEEGGGGIGKCARCRLRKSRTRAQQNMISAARAHIRK